MKCYMFSMLFVDARCLLLLIIFHFVFDVLRLPLFVRLIMFAGVCYVLVFFIHCDLLRVV